MTATDSQANLPQVAGPGNESSDTTARFPTNKQNEPSIAVNPVDPSHVIAGSNDEQRQPACGDGPVRGDTKPGDCSFFPSVGTDGVYTSADGGATWTNRGLLDELWGASPYVSDGDAVIVYGPKPAGKGFSYDHGARAYYVGLGSFKDGQSTFNANKAPEFIIVSHSDNDGMTWSDEEPADRYAKEPAPTGATKPAPEDPKVCPGQFGNTDLYVSVITP